MRMILFGLVCRRIYLMLLFLLSFSVVFSQENEIIGRVVSLDDENGLPGVTIQLEGTSTGTATDIDGIYHLKVPSLNGKLIFSFIGYATQTIEISNKTVIDVILLPTAAELDAVVVTALGIKREKKSIGYSVQEVKGDELEITRDASVINQLSGKVSGLTISATNAGAGSSSRIILRGNNSFTNNNQALIVVDGMPIENTTISNSEATWGGRDSGNGVTDLNPDDIESISVLKGASASALYGSRAANGVILITTKKGSKGNGIGVSYSNNTSFNYAYIHYDLQNIYGGGRNGKFNPPFQTIGGVPQYDVINSSAYGSWGPKMEGQEIIDWDGNTTTYSPQPDNYKNYFRPGLTFNNALSFDGGTNNISYRFSLADLRTKEIIPGASYARTNLSLNFNAKFLERFEFQTYISYVHQNTDNRYGLSDSHDNVNRNYIMMPRHVSNQSLENNIMNEVGEEQTWYMSWAWQTNPYYNPKFRLNEDKKNRILGNASLSYKLNDHLDFLIRTAPDVSYYKSNDKGYVGGIGNAMGSYSEGEIDQFLINSDFLISYNNSTSDKFFFTVSGGGNAMYYKIDRYHGNTVGGLEVPNEFSLDNSVDTPYQRNEYYEKAINSLYAFARLDYKHFLFLDLTGRNDWSSTLPESNNSYFYPSISSGFAFTELIQNKSTLQILSFGKVRASYAEVGNDAEPYQLSPTFYVDSTSSVYGTYAYITNRIPATDLKPERTKSVELGTDLRFYMNRISLDFTWYKTNSVNQIVPVDISQTSGSTQALINAGNIENSGVELQLGLIPVQNAIFIWDLKLNYTKNKSKVIELAPGVDNLLLLEHWRLSIEARAGNPYGDIVGYAVLRDENGNKLVDEYGMYLRDSIPRVLGNVAPDHAISFANNFICKNFSLSFLIDARIGGEMFAGTNMYGYGYSGNFSETIKGRDAWYESEAERVDAGVDPDDWIPTGGYLAEGVYAEGSVIDDQDVSGQANESYVNPEKYWDQYSNWTNEIHEPFVYDASFVKLREVVLSYQLPEQWTRKVKMTSATVSLYGRNLWVIYKKVPNIDPETFYTNGNGQGYELYSYPTVRSFGFSLTVNF